MYSSNCSFLYWSQMFVEFPQYYRFLRVKVHHKNYDWHYSIALVSAGLHSLRYCFTYTINSFDMCFIILYVAEGKTLIYWNSNFNRWGSSLLYQWLEMSGGVETSFEKGNSSWSHTIGGIKNYDDDEGTGCDEYIMSSIRLHKKRVIRLQYLLG